MKSTKHHFRLESGEYLADGIMCSERKITIFENGKDISGQVTGVIITTEPE